MKMLMFAAPTLLIAAPAAAQVMAPTEYVATAGASDLYEITSSQTVLESTADPKVRQLMDTGHGATSSQMLER